MELLPILAALRRNKVGAILVALQIALTLAVVSNALSIIQHDRAAMRRPSGVDEANVFTLQNHWVGQPDNLRARIEADLVVLRGMPGVIDAMATNSYPLRGGGWSWGVRLKPDPNLNPTAVTSAYFEDEHGLDSMGMKLIAGRWFTRQEIGEYRMNDVKDPDTVVVTSALAKKLFPGGNAVGQIVYMQSEAPVRIIGVVDRAQTPWPAQDFGAAFAENSTFLPFQFVNNGLVYVVRTRPGQLTAVVRGAPETLAHITRQRVIDQVRTFAETRNRAYRAQKSTSWLLGTVCGLLLAVTAFGTVGLTTYWVSQRRRQIGMRRALGARKTDILRYFHTENFLIASTGALIGICAGLGVNLWMASHLAIERMSPLYIAIGAGIVLVLSQLAVVWPALRAASIAPSIATRGL